MAFNVRIKQLAPEAGSHHMTSQTPEAGRVLPAARAVSEACRAKLPAQDLSASLCFSLGPSQQGCPKQENPGQRLLEGIPACLLSGS